MVYLPVDNLLVCEEFTSYKGLDIIFKSVIINSEVQKITFNYLGAFKKLMTNKQKIIIKTLCG